MRRCCAYGHEHPGTMKGVQFLDWRANVRFSRSMRNFSLTLKKEHFEDVGVFGPTGEQ